MRAFIRVATLAVLFATGAGAVPLKHFEGSLWGFPSLTDADGKPLAEGRIVQWNDGDGLHVKGTYDFPDGAVLEEETLLSQDKNALSQRLWSWQLKRGGEVVERYSVDFESGEVRALQLGGRKPKTWTKKMELSPGHTFVGVGFLYAVKNLRARLTEGETVTLEAVGFMPRPQKAKVTIRHAGIETVTMGGRELRADHMVIHPEIPRIAKLFVKVPDNHLWLYRASPPAFLRSEGPMMSLGTVRIDVLPSDAPAQRSQARRSPTPK